MYYDILMKQLLFLVLLSCFVIVWCAREITSPSVSNSGYLWDHSNHVHHAVVSEESFLVDMIPHHQEAVDTSLRLNQITQNLTIKALTQEIVSWQDQEIALMQSWLGKWYPEGSYVSTYTPMMRDTSTISAIATIEKFRLEDMIQHHMWAIMMAHDVIALDPREEVVSLANEIITAQYDEIALMQELLVTYE